MPRGWWWALVALMFCIGALPWLLAWVGVDGEIIYAPICHRQPERSLHIHGEVMSVCSRCAGIYLGTALAALVAFAPRSHPWWMAHGTKLVIVAVAANLLDWAWSLWMPLSHVSRVLIGGSFGLVATAFLLAALATPRARQRGRGEPTTDPRTPASSEI